MKDSIELVLTPEEAYDPVRFQQIIAEKFNLQDEDRIFNTIRRSIDARGKRVVIRITGEIVSRDSIVKSFTYKKDYQDVSMGKPVILVGAGPAGMFAALRLMEAGMKPILIERGKDVQARRRDIAAINKDHLVNPDSNYCFGEGGAGTYSDGKLYTRSTKRGNVRKMLEIMVAHGATEEILFDAHPHIGTNKLPLLVKALRETIQASGGEILFNTRVIDFLMEGDTLNGVETSDGNKIVGEAVILATGHSARDIYELLERRKILIEAKPFALGVRVEHPQELIDQIQYHCDTDRGPYLPASSYSMVHQTGIGKRQRGVFSFCMCPGGFIVPAATSPGEVVVNGMSPSRRDSRFANSGIVMAVELEDFKTDSPLAGLQFQKEVEQRACRLAGGGQSAPAQRLMDFVERKLSVSLPETSYQPGLVSIDLAEVLPKSIAEGLRDGFRNFGTRMKGYLTNEAQIVGVESRTSSPVRVPRDKDSLEHPVTKRLFPCGEGAGFAGGIVSAAMDGERCAEAVINKYGR